MGYELVLAQKIVETVFFAVLGIAALDALVILILKDLKKSKK